MQKYELMVIIENSLDAKAAEKHAKDLDARIEKEFGGKITFTDFWGERGFAYKINKQKWGYYHVNQFQADPAKVQELRHELNLDGVIVRSLITKVDANAPSPRKYADMKKEYEAQEKAIKDEKNAKAEEKTTPAKKEKLTTVKPDSAEATTGKEEPKAEAKKEAAPAKTEEPKATEAPKDDVDKKLDAIVDESAADL